jgi:hypothetical protein
MKRERISWWGASYEVEGSKLSLRSKLAKYFFLFIEGQARASLSLSLSLVAINQLSFSILFYNTLETQKRF